MSSPTKPEAGPSPPPPKRYGIERAIQLMRSLPTEQNPELVAMVITSTLESLDMNVSDIIEDARSRQADLEARIGTIKAKNSELEKEIERGVDEIVALEASLAETLSVKERLELAHDHHAAPKASSGS
jgi:predicted  nucleic acid-binding Zn-ribbon protein